MVIHPGHPHPALHRPQRADRAREMGIKGFIMKPVAKGELARAVRGILNDQ